MIEPPLPFGNAAARWFYVLLRGLVERGHHVTAYAACTRPEEIEPARQLFPAPDYDLRLFPVPGSSSLGSKWRTLFRPNSRLFSPQLRHDLKTRLDRGDWDILHLEQLWCGWLPVPHADPSRTLVNVINLYEVDLASAASDGPVAAWRRSNLVRAERRLIRRFGRLTTLSAPMAEHLRRLHPQARAIHVVPLGLDSTLYRFVLPSESPEHPPTVGLIGSFNWQPTYAAGVRLLTRLWPRIRERVPDARLRIAGRGARSALGAIEATGDVRIEEDVPEIEPYFRELDVLLYAPSPASGMKVKVLEAFALGVPVVTTLDGVEGLPAVDGIHAGIVNDPEDDDGLVERTVRALAEPETRRTWSLAARRLLETVCGPSPTLDGVEGIYREMRPGAGPAGSGRLEADTSSGPQRRSGAGER